MIVYVESNFVLELALNQEQSKFARKILKQAKQRKVDLAIPAYGLAEPAWTLRNREQRRENLLREMSTDVRELGRSKARSDLTAALMSHIKILRTAGEEDHRKYDEVVRTLLGCARVLDLTVETLREALRVRKKLLVTRHDSYILGSILTDLRKSRRSAGEVRLFISRDTKLGKQEISDEFRKFDCRIIPDFKSSYDFIASASSSK